MRLQWKNHLKQSLLAFLITLCTFACSKTVIADDVSKNVCLLGGKSVSELKQMAESDDAYSQGVYGALLYLNLIPSENSNKANGTEPQWAGLAVTEKSMQAKDPIFWVAKSVKKNNPIGSYILGCLLLNGELKDFEGYTSESAFKSAFVGMKQLAASDDVIAIVFLGMMNEMGQGTDVDYKSAIQEYERAIKLGSPYAEYRLGNMYLQGKGVNADLKKANEIFKKAQANGIPGVEIAQEKLLVNADGGVKLLSPFARFVCFSVSALASILAALIGWFSFYWLIAPIKLLFKAPMEIFIDRVVGAILFGVIAWAFTFGALMKAFIS